MRVLIELVSSPVLRTMELCRGRFKTHGLTAREDACDAFHPWYLSRIPASPMLLTCCVKGEKDNREYFPGAIELAFGRPLIRAQTENSCSYFVCVTTLARCVSVAHQALADAYWLILAVLLGLRACRPDIPCSQCC